MIRRIPKDTEFFHFYNANPKDRRTSDCVVRALSTALNQSWEQTYKELFEIAMKKCTAPEDISCVYEYLTKKGCVRIAQPKRRDGTKFTGEEVCYLIQEGKFVDNWGVCLLYKNYFMNIGSGHCSCIIDGKINDIWNCSYDKVGVMWGVPEEIL